MSLVKMSLLISKDSKKTLAAIKRTSLDFRLHWDLIGKPKLRHPHTKVFKIWTCSDLIYSGSTHPSSHVCLVL